MILLLELELGTTGVDAVVVVLSTVAGVVATGVLDAVVSLMGFTGVELLLLVGSVELAS